MSKGKNFKRLEYKAALGVALVFSIGLGGLVALILWIRSDPESEIASRLRGMIGVELKEEAKPAPPLAEAAPPPAPPEPEPEPLPEPVPESPPPPPEPELLYWSDLVGRPDLWPDDLQVTFKKTVPIRFNETVFGEMFFIPGQRLEVDGLRDDSEIYGSINDVFVVMPVGFTDLDEWFAGKHGADYRLLINYGTIRDSGSGQPELSERTKVQILEELRQWCLINFTTKNLEQKADAFELRWAPRTDLPIDFRGEARELARQYLKIQAAHGGTDNYAACRIIDPRNEALLGSGSIFIPDLIQR